LEASFSKSFRGYDVSEVEAYVQSVQTFEAESQSSLAQSTKKLAELEAELTRLREIESSLFRALKLAEESQQNFAAKMEKEAKSILDKAYKEAEAIKKKAEVDAQKQALLTENERKLTLALAGQELKEQERQLRNLQETQKEIAAQLKNISEQTLGSIAQWGNLAASPEISVETNPAAPVKRGRKPGVKNKPKAAVAKAIKNKPAAKAKSAAKAKPVAKAKPAAKRGPKPKISLETVSDDGLPTLNKVLEAYAKSSGPRGKVGEIN
jgi:cell division initiation protein